MPNHSTTTTTNPMHIHTDSTSHKTISSSRI